MGEQLLELYPPRYIRKQVITKEMSNLGKIYLMRDDIKFLFCVQRVGKRKDAYVVDDFVLKFLPSLSVDSLNYRPVNSNYEACYLNVGKYVRPRFAFDLKVYNEACDMVFSVMQGALQDSMVNFNFNSAAALLNKDSSPGFPWNSVHTQKRVLAQEHDFEVYVLRLMQDIMLKEKREVVWKVTTKVELKPKNKVLMNKVRVFTAAPAEMTIIGIMLFGHQNELFSVASVNSVRFQKRDFPCFVGVSKFYRGWNDLYNYLTDNNNPLFRTGYAFDFSEFDASIPLELIKTVYMMRWKCFNTEHQTDETLSLVDWFAQAIADSPLLLDSGDVVRKPPGGNASGQQNTLTDNCLFNLFYWFYTYLILKPKSLAPTYQEFSKGIRLMVCGDDSIMTVRPDWQVWFNPSSIKQVFSAIGMGLKIDTEKAQDVQDMQFCSHWFKRDGTSFVPVPEYGKVISSLVYKNKSENIKSLWQRACALRIESYYSLESRELIDYLLNQLKNHDELKNETLSDGSGSVMSYEKLMTMYKSDKELEKLYKSLSIGCLPENNSESLYLLSNYYGLE